MATCRTRRTKATSRSYYSIGTIAPYSSSTNVVRLKYISHDQSSKYESSSHARPFIEKNCATMPVSLRHHDRTTPSQLCTHPCSVHTSPILRFSLLSRDCQRRGQVFTKKYLITCHHPILPSFLPSSNRYV